MQTQLKGTRTAVNIGRRQPIALIGNRIDASRNAAIATAIRNQDTAAIEEAACAQAREGAHILLVKVRAAGLDEQKHLPAVVEAVAHAAGLPLAIDAVDPAALAAALECCPGRPLVSGINLTPAALKELLPLAVRANAAVIALAQGPNDGLTTDGHPPATFEALVELGREILRQCITAGVARQDVIVQLPIPPLHENPHPAKPFLDALAHISRIDDINLALNLQSPTSNPQSPNLQSPVSQSPISQSPNLQSPISQSPVSHSPTLPLSLLKTMLTTLAIHQGATCLIADPLQASHIAQSADLLFGKKESVQSELATGR